MPRDILHGLLIASLTALAAALTGFLIVSALPPDPPIQHITVCTTGPSGQEVCP